MWSWVTIAVKDLKLSDCLVFFVLYIKRDKKPCILSCISLGFRGIVSYQMFNHIAIINIMVKYKGLKGRVGLVALGNNFDPTSLVM